MPTIHSTDIEWINWYKYVARTYGTGFAATLFLQVWAKQGMPAANTAQLRATLKEDGVTIDENVFNQVADIGYSVGSGIENFLHTGKVIAITSVAVLGGITVLLLINIARDPNKAMATAAKLIK